ncbi:hypothetical protein WMF18_38520 [Sorangium sp. So ce315]|uniref:hypothetical protein n=1 Tax=Sorangium sp. So ce315 TaxID=3133299 RepID=UPI003F5EAD2E
MRQRGGITSIIESIREIDLIEPIIVRRDTPCRATSTMSRAPIRGVTLSMPSKSLSHVPAASPGRTPPHLVRNNRASMSRGLSPTSMPGAGDDFVKSFAHRDL